MNIYDYEEKKLSELGLAVPAWIDQEITTYDVAAVCADGCASGAYMPAVTYQEAAETMAEHGDDVLDFLEDQLGELPTLPESVSWRGIAVFFLSAAVELWGGSIAEELEEKLKLAG